MIRGANLIDIFESLLARLFRRVLNEFWEDHYPELVKILHNSREGSLLMSPKEVCHELGGISKVSLYRLRKAQKLTGLKINGSLKFERAEVMAFIRSLKKTADDQR